MSKLLLAGIISTLIISTTSATEDACSKVATGLGSVDQEEFLEALQGVLEHQCTYLLPRVADLFVTRLAPTPYYAADLLALSGQKEYGPLLVHEYFKLSADTDGIPGPGSLRYEVVLACSDLARGQDLRKVEWYATRSVPTMDSECLNEYRRLLRYHDSDPHVLYFAMDVLQETSTPAAMDIVSQCLANSDVNVREQAVIAMQHMPLDASLETFKKASEDSNRAVRYQVIRVLAKEKDARVAELFKARIKVEQDPPTLAILRRYLKE